MDADFEYGPVTYRGVEVPQSIFEGSTDEYDYGQAAAFKKGVDAALAAKVEVKPLVVNFGDPEPDRSKAFIDPDGDRREYRDWQWTYYMEGLGKWSLGVSYERIAESFFPWVEVV